MSGTHEGEPTLLRERVEIGKSLGPLTYVFALVAAVISPVVVIYAPASAGAALLALATFSVFRLRGIGSVRSLAVTYAVSLLVGFVIVGLVAHDWTLVVTSMVVAVGMSAVGFAAALTRAYRVQVESISR